MRRALSISPLAAALAFAALSATAEPAAAHCQVPCGIYDDHARVHAMLEDVTTITKAMDQITRLAGKTDAQSLNQVTRWIATKEHHASNIISVVSEYFLTQKIKAADPKDAAAWQAYLDKLVAHHRVMRLAMKAKQTVDTKVAAELAEAVHALERLWPTK
ncbi:MAG: superoxide dismutase [Proteobacteria bacterium]|nr:MAG: superoxide dismutase [Pseudomonadota bacterium]